jgi:hypothetical protein
MAKVGAKLSAGGFGRGKCTKEHDRQEHRSTQVRGSRKEITPLLLLYCLYIFGSMEVQQWWLPSSLLEEEEALLTLRLSSDQPLVGLPMPPYIVVSRVTMVI